MTTDKQVVLSGIRATGRMHLGNYLGALRYFAKLDADPAYQCFFFVANLHTLTTGAGAEAAKAMRESLVGIILDFLAIGIDPEQSIIFAQSSVPETAELAWILQCLTGINDLDSMAAYAEKRDRLERDSVRVSEGLRAYPVLMAADILGPRANLVPVGQDQHAHVELARTLARRFNREFECDLFPIPELLEGDGVRVPSLGRGKMGKSEDDQSTIYLGDEPNAVTLKIKRGMTDPARETREDPGTPEKCPIYTMHQLLSTGEEIQWAANGCRTAGIGCIECKAVVSSHVNDLLAPIRERRAELEAQGGHDLAMDIMRDGGQRARAVIAETVERAKQLAGVPAY